MYCINVGDPDHSHRFNPMDALSRHPLKAVDDCRRLAELLMPKDARNEDDHWRKRSVSILTGFILHVHDQHGDTPERCNLATVDALLAAPPAELADTLKAMAASHQVVVRSVAGRLQTSLASEEGLNLPEPALQHCQGHRNLGRGIRARAAGPARSDFKRCPCCGKPNMSLRRRYL